MIALLLPTAFLRDRTIRQPNENARSVAPLWEAQNFTPDVLLTLMDAETGQSFLITGNDLPGREHEAAGWTPVGRE